MEITLESHAQKMFRSLLFSKIVPAIKKMDLLSERQRQRFAELGILQFETWADPLIDLQQTAKGATSARLDEEALHPEIQKITPAASC